MLFDPVLSHERFSLSHRGNNIKAMRKGSLQAKGRWVVSIYIYKKKKRERKKDRQLPRKKMDYIM